MQKGPGFIIVLFLLLGSVLGVQASEKFSIEKPEIILTNINSEYSLIFNDEELREEFKHNPIIIINSEEINCKIVGNIATFEYLLKEKEQLTIQVLDQQKSFEVNPIPLWMSILPPLIAIVLALLFREVFTALIIGIVFGASLIFYYQGTALFLSIFQGIFALVDTYILNALNDSSHLSIILFSMLIGAMVNLISSNGGMTGVVNFLSRYAKSPRSGQFITWFLGVAIFFDDYANTLVVGNTMRSVTDRLKVSREKLAYIVDSTAAPIASIAFVTTWIGAEIGYIEDGLKNLGLDESPHHVFLNSLSYSFYPVLALLFILLIIWQRRDFGPMLKAEKRARENAPTESESTPDKIEGDKLKVKTKGKPRAINAMIPVVTLILATMAGLLYTGLETVSWDSSIPLSKNLSAIIGSADSYRALIWSSISGVTVALLLTLSQRLLSLQQCVESLVNGFKTMMTAILILILAWSLAKLTEDLHTADFITQFLLSVKLKPTLIPTLTFIIAGLIAFSTGSSWSTMAILYPLILPATWLLATEFGYNYDQSMAIFHNVVASVLAGSVLGDHCSPISDTTILSSLASSCNHIDHVKTQLPYALVVGSTALVFGTLLSSFNISTWILFPVCIVILFLIVRVFGKRITN